MVSKKRDMRTYSPTLCMKYSELRETELVPERIFDAWYSHQDGLLYFRDKTKIRSEFAWSLKMSHEEIYKFNNKNKKLVLRRKLRQKLILTNINRKLYISLI